MEQLLMIVAVVVIVVVILFVGFIIKSIKREKAVNAALSSIQNFSPDWKYYLDDDRGSGIALDERRELVCLFKIKEFNVQTRVFAYSDIISAELFEDGQTIIKTDSSSLIGRSLVGDLLFGKTGAIIGGLSAEKVAGPEIKNIELQIIVNDSAAPLHDVVFLSLASGVDRSSSLYTKALKEAREWHARLKIAIEKSDREAHSEKLHEETADFIVSDEIMKLYKLKESGILTEAEFVRQKTKLLE